MDLQLEIPNSGLCELASSFGCRIWNTRTCRYKDRCALVNHADLSVLYCLQVFILSFAIQTKCVLPDRQTTDVDAVAV